MAKPSKRLIQFEYSSKRCTLKYSNDPTMCNVIHTHTVSKPAHIHTHTHNLPRPTTVSAGVHNSRGVHASGTQLCLASKLATISGAASYITRGEGEAFSSSYGLLSCSPKYRLSYNSHSCKGNCYTSLLSSANVKILDGLHQ